MSARAEAVRELQMAIDLLLVDVWAAVSVEGSTLGPTLEDEDARAAFASSLRVAFTEGYNLALREAQNGVMGSFARGHQLPPK